MLVRFLEGCKLLAWGMIAGAILVAVIISHRAPNSIWTGGSDTSDLHSALKRDVASLQTIRWNDPTDADDFVPAPEVSDASPLARAVAEPRLPKPLPLERPENVACGSASNCQNTPFATVAHQEDLTSDFVAQPPQFDDQICASHVQNRDSRQPSFACGSEAPERHSTTNSVESACNVHKLETSESTEVTSRQVTMRDASTNQTVATLTIAGLIESDALPPEALELARAERLHNRAAVRDSNRSDQKQNFVHAFRDENTGHFKIEAHTIEISEIARQIAERFGLPIVCHDSAVGTVSASVTEVTLVRAVRRLVEPFGFAVVEYGPQIVIGDLEALEYAARMDATAQEAQMIADREAAAMAAAELADADMISENTKPDPSTTQDLTHSAAARRLPPVPAVSRASHDAVAMAGKFTASHEEIAIGIQAKAMVAEGQLSETIDMLTVAIQDYPNSAMLYRMLAEIYFHRNDLRAAERAAQRSLAIDKFNPLTNKVYGDVLSKLGQSNRSQHYLQQAKHLGRH